MEEYKFPTLGGVHYVMISTQKRLEEANKKRIIKIDHYMKIQY